MLTFGLVALGVLAIVVIDEILWHKGLLKGEYSRKFVHILVGIFAAFWPWLLTWRQVQVLSIGLLIGVVINRLRVLMHYNVGIKRRTYGDFFFAIGIGLSALITTNKIFFAVAILNMAVADGLAAIVGKRWGGRSPYRVFGYTKTIAGTMTFWLTATTILGVGLLFAHDFISFEQYALMLILLPPVLTVLENLSLFGMDDATIPVVTLAVLQLL